MKNDHKNKQMINVERFFEHFTERFPYKDDADVLISISSLFGLSVKESKVLIKERFGDIPGLNENLKQYYESDLNMGKLVNMGKMANYRGITSKRIKSAYIPEDVYPSLPTFLKELTDDYTNERERDVFLTGAITMLSGLFNNVKGRYRREEFYANLNSFIIAPPASGKGVISEAKKLGVKIHEQHRSLPTGRRLFIPGNSSSAKLFNMLSENNGEGIIFENEADTMTQTLLKEWGNFSVLLRNSFHHETISYARKKDNEDIEIDQPKISVCVSGTPDQFIPLLKSVGNGLFSRLIMYNYDAIPEFDSIDPEDYNSFSNLHLAGDDLLKLYNDLADRELTFVWTKEQNAMLNEKYKKLIQSLYKSHGSETSGIVKRLGIIQFRISMVLSILRFLEVGVPEDDSFICLDEDYLIADSLAEVYLQHALDVYERLPKGQYQQEASKALLLLKLLPHDYDIPRKEADALGAYLGLNPKTVYNYLRTLKDGGLITSPRYGYFRVTN